MYVCCADALQTACITLQQLQKMARLVRALYDFAGTGPDELAISEVRRGRG
jgi:hypothetical protein